MFKGNKNKNYIEKINGLYHKSRVKHHGLQIGSNIFWYYTLNDLSVEYEHISIDPGYYNPSGLKFKSKSDFIKKLRLFQKLNNVIRIK